MACHFQEEDDEALQKELKEAFRLYDKEGNGYIPTSSLREILAALDDQITPDQMDGMIAEIDTDGSGTVDFDGEYHVSSNYPILSFACPSIQKMLHRELKKRDKNYPVGFRQFFCHNSVEVEELSIAASISK